ncbi:MAG: lysoplasmalogenase [Gemmatimonadota bacterium]
MRAWQLLSVALLLAFVLVLRADSNGSLSQLTLLTPMCAALLLSLTIPTSLEDEDRYAQFVTLGLLLSLAADMLRLQPESRFVAGLLVFLLARLSYLAAFTRDGGFSWSGATGRPLAALGATLMAMLWPTLGPLRVPVLAYMLVLLVMAWQALERSRRDAHEGAWWAAVGAVLFVASDAALGLARFRGDFPGSRSVVLGTYYLAQWMIATSVLVRAGRLAR